MTDANVIPPPPLLRTILGEVLRRARREQGRTLADVARHARVSMQYLSELERGRKEASSEVLAALAEALGVELADVLAEVGRTLAADRLRRAALAGSIPHVITARTVLQRVTASSPSTPQAFALAA